MTHVVHVLAEHDDVCKYMYIFMVGILQNDNHHIIHNPGSIPLCSNNTRTCRKLKIELDSEHFRIIIRDILVAIAKMAYRFNETTSTTANAV